MRYPLILLASLALAGCALHSPQTEALPSADYRCDDGSEFHIVFDDEVARLTQGGETYVLPTQRPASGMWYATPTHEFRGKGEEATWTVGRRAPSQCRVVR
ncbi:MliC family protein [Halomonas sp. 328]|uniref:MliC family protein n=1 Tax=Halomonas sp. 328 TaxID=2776704 RepID=UPI0018A71B1A|nr:MliC family protein [Halomonas sp. 328]MBF8223140.1 MliC family protein [Halomonas sp. 328]